VRRGFEVQFHTRKPTFAVTWEHHASRKRHELDVNHKEQTILQIWRDDGRQTITKVCGPGWHTIPAPTKVTLMRMYTDAGC
jgi:hypothetical protein